jgi:S1-C subfamily serine protease
MSDPVSDLAPLLGLSSALTKLVADAAPSLVTVTSHRSRAAGFVWKDGFIVTPDETLADEGEVSVRLPNGETVPATIAGRDHTTDMALLRLDTKGAVPAKFTQSAPLVGSLAVAASSDDGAPTATFGLVALSGGAWRSLRGGEIDARIELDVRLRRGTQGGLALGPDGAAFGMVVAGARRRVLVIPSATIARVAARLETHGRVGRGYLGLALQPVRLDADGVGAMVMGVDSAGPGAAAGVRQGDVIVSWNGEALRGVRALVRALGPDSVGVTAELSLRRGGEPVTAKLTIGERPAA